MSDDGITPRTPAANSPTTDADADAKFPHPGRPRPRLGGGAVFALTFAVAAAFAWAFAPKGTPQQVPPGALQPPTPESGPRQREDRVPRTGDDTEHGGAVTKGAPPSGGQLSGDAIFAQASPAVVQVVTHDRQLRALASGSGFLVSSDGLVATNFHVIQDAYSARVVLADKTSLPVVGAVALDRDADLAVLKVAGWFGGQPLALAESDLPPVGAKVYAIGNPRGLANTLSDGLVSGHQEIPGYAVTMIQTTAPISPGSSGGPLLAADGKVVGVTAASRVDGQNLNFAVPVCHLTRLLLEHDGDGEVVRFPLALPAAAEPARAAGGWSAPEWSPDDLENAGHFVRALRNSNQAWGLCREKGHRTQPSALYPYDKAEFCYLMEKANREARAVRKDVLKRMHAALPEAFDDYVIATACIATNVRENRPDPRGQAAWRHWVLWWDAHRREVRVPEEAKR